MSLSPQKPKKQHTSSPALQAKTDSLLKLNTYVNDLTANLTKTTRVFQEFKTKTFFFPEPDFIKSFSVSLKEANSKVQDMGGLLSSYMDSHSLTTKDTTTTTTPSDPTRTKTQTKTNGATPEPPALKTSNGTVSSITPPASEVGNEEEFSLDNSWLAGRGRNSLGKNSTDRLSGISSTDGLSGRNSTDRLSGVSSIDGLLSGRNSTDRLSGGSSTDGCRNSSLSSKKRASLPDACSAQPTSKKPKRNLIDDYLTKDRNQSIKTPPVKEEEEEEEDDEEDEKEGTTQKKEAEEEFEVESIVDIMKSHGKAWYRVKWKGYGHEDNTWEPTTNVTGCEDLLYEFFTNRLSERSSAKTEDLNSHALPLDQDNKDLLLRAFNDSTVPTDKDIKEGIRALVSVKPPAIRTDEERTELIKKALCSRKRDTYLAVLRTLILDRALQQASADRVRQQAELRMWERNINSICFDVARIMVENFVDLEMPPTDFLYLNKSDAGEGVTIPTDPVVGCECDDCGASKSCCPTQMNTHVAYNKYGRLRVSLGTPIYECNRLCTCSASCFNRVVQKGRTVGLCIFRTANGRGWGVKATENIKKDSLVTEYVGEIITSEEAERRGKMYDAQGCTYLFDLDFNKGDQNPYTIDAAKCGNVSHFINHSCDPNLVVFNVWVDCLDPDLPRLALFSTRDIKKGEELTFDYNSGLRREQMKGDLEEQISTPEKRDIAALSSSEVILKTPKGNRGLQYGKTQCRCGAANCRRYFF